MYLGLGFVVVYYEKLSENGYTIEHYNKTYHIWIITNK